SDAPANLLCPVTLFSLLRPAPALISFRITNTAAERSKRRCTPWQCLDLRRVRFRIGSSLLQLAEKVVEGARSTPRALKRRHISNDLTARVKEGAEKRCFFRFSALRWGCARARAPRSPFISSFPTAPEHTSARALHRRYQLHHPHQVVRGCGQTKNPVHPPPPTELGPMESRDSLIQLNTFSIRRRLFCDRANSGCSRSLGRSQFGQFF